ncbi:adenine-specific methyltransferase EcoRI family protein [Escherichia coli]
MTPSGAISHFIFAQNFERLGLKKLISTSYAHQSKQLNTAYQPSLFESESEQYDSDKSQKHGKIYTLTEDSNHDGVIDFKDIKWQYLQGDGDFRSDEIKALRDESDIIITNPPFFRCFANLWHGLWKVKKAVCRYR